MKRAGWSLCDWSARRALAAALLVALWPIGCDERASSGERETDKSDRSSLVASAGNHVTVTLSDVRPDHGHCVIGILPNSLYPCGPGDKDGNRSELRLFEDGVEIGPPHSLHADVRALGEGRYSHWGDTVYFSSSDNSDPLTNGRRYTAQYPVDGAAAVPQWDVAPRAVAHLSGHAYRYDLPDFMSAWVNDDEAENASRLLLFEDGVLLTRPHGSLDGIAALGGGRYRHGARELWFSSSDGTDPRTNGRSYAIGLAPRADHRFSMPGLAPPPAIRATLPRLRFASPAEGQAVGTALPWIEIADPDPSLLYYFEVDVDESFDSPVVHRRPRTAPTQLGRNPLIVLDRSPQFGPAFEPPYRLGALAAPLVEMLATRRDGTVDLLAQRLGYGLPQGPTEIKEVYEFMRAQLTPGDGDTLIRPVEETLARDRGFCIAYNRVNARLLEMLGYRVRRATVSIPRFHGLQNLEGHSSSEVFHDGRWSIVDPYVQYLLPGTSFADLAAPTDPAGAPFVKRLTRTSDMGRLSDADLEIRMSDYAALRRYDRFDNVAMIDAGECGTPDEEAALYAGEPGQVPESDFGQLWAEERMTVHVRARGLRLSTDQLWFWATGQDPVRLAPEPIEATPWATLRFDIDLRAAYGLGSIPAASPPTNASGH